MVPNLLTFTNAVTINSTTNAAKVGDAMSLYVTGEGIYTNTCQPQSTVRHSDRHLAGGSGDADPHYGGGCQDRGLGLSRHIPESIR